MTRETVDQTEERARKRRQLERLLEELQELDSLRRRVGRFARFEREREARIADRQNRTPRRTVKEEELAEETRRVETKIDRTVAAIGDLVAELGLEGVNLW